MYVIDAPDFAHVAGSLADFKRRRNVHAEDWKDTDANSVIKVIILNLPVYDRTNVMIMLSEIAINPNPWILSVHRQVRLDNLRCYPRAFYVS